METKNILSHELYFCDVLAIHVAYDAGFHPRSCCFCRISSAIRLNEPGPVFMRSLSQERYPDNQFSIEYSASYPWHLADEVSVSATYLTVKSHLVL